MYSEIASNKRRTVILMALFTAVILLAGYAIGQTSGYGYNGLLLAALFSFLMTLFSYFKGDKIALLSAGAKTIVKEDNPYFYRLVENLAITAGQPMPKLYMIDDSAINAFACGRSPVYASVAVTRGALEKLTNEELEGVLAHELSHIKNYDVRLMTVVSALLGTIIILGDFVWRMRLFGGRSRDRENNGNPIVLVVGLILLILSPIIGQLIQLAISRRREFLADASGALLTRYPEGLARALEKIASENIPLKRATTATAHLFISSPFGKKGSISKFFMTHPPLEERIALLRGMSSPI